MENEIQIISGKVFVDHVHMFISYKPQQSVSKIVQFLKGTSSRLLMQDFASLRKQFGEDIVGKRIPSHSARLKVTSTGLLALLCCEF
jgi:REP element-mobilizing transposase RayT